MTEGVTALPNLLIVAFFCIAGFITLISVILTSRFEAKTYGKEIVKATRIMEGEFGDDWVSKHEYEELCAEKNTLEAKIKILAEEIEDLQSYNKDYQKKISALESHISCLKAENCRLRLVNDCIDDLKEENNEQD